MATTAPLPELVTLDTLAAEVAMLRDLLGIPERQENNQVIVVGTGLWGHVSYMDGKISQLVNDISALRGSVQSAQILIADLRRRLAALEAVPPAA